MFSLCIALSRSHVTGLHFRLGSAHCGKAFARKLLHIPLSTWETVKCEASAIIKLSAQGGHKHIINFLRLGELRHSAYYFIDMELCDLNLETFVHSPSPSPTNPSESIPYFIRDRPPPIKAQQIWNVMRQITCGTEYIHSLNLVHRDLKPANNMSHFKIGLFMC
jgi:serine/threonine protein kinase